MAYALPTGLAQQAREAAPSPPPDPVAPQTPGVISSSLTGMGDGFAPALPPSPFSIPGFGQSYDEGYQPATGGYSSQSGITGTPLSNIGNAAGGLVGWGNLPDALKPDSGASFPEQFGAGKHVIMDALMQAGVPSGLQMLNETAPADTTLMHSGLGGFKWPWQKGEPEPFPEITPEQSARVQQAMEQNYGGQAAGQVKRTGEASPDALRPPEYGMNPDEVVAGNKAALERATGSTVPLDPTSPYYDPKTDLMMRIEDAKPLQEQNSELLSQFRSRQAGAFQGALESGPGGREGAMQARSAMQGAAERVTFQPLRDALAPGAEDTLFDQITGSTLRPFEKANAYSALDDILGGQVPTPYDLAQLEKAFPGVTASLQRSKIISPPQVSIVKDFIEDPIKATNNAIRASNTLFDFATLGRLGPQAGLYDPAAFGNSWKTAYVKALKDTSVVKQALTEIDDAAIAKGLPTAAEWRDAGLKMANPDADPGFLAKVPGVDRIVNGYHYFQMLFKPQMANTEYALRLAAGETPSMEEIARGANVVSGTTNASLPDSANFVLRFPSWLAAQYELLGRAAMAPARPNVTNQMALQSVSRLITFGLGATAAINALQPDKKTQFRGGVPMANIPDVLAEHIGMPKGSTIDMFGPLGEIVSKTVGLGTAGVQGASDAEGGAKEKAVGAAKGVGTGLWRMYDGLAGPIIRLTYNLVAGQTTYGQPTRNAGYIAHEVAPFEADLLDPSGQSTATKVGGTAGLRIHEPSARDQYAQSLGKQSWNDLDPSQRSGFVNEQPSVTQQQVADLTKAQRERVTSAAQALSTGKLPNGQPFTAKDFRDVLHDAEGTLFAQKQVVYQNAGTKPGQDKILDPYFKLLDESTDPVTGKPNYDLVDEYRASLSPADNAYIDRNTGLTFKDIPAVAQYKADAKAIADSGYWNLADALAADFGQQLGYKGVKTQADLLQQLAEEAKQTFGNDPLATEKFIDRVMGKYNAQLGKEHMAFLADRPQVVPLLQKWGYGLPTKALGLLPQ